MEFFEFILVLSITVVLPLGIVKAIMDHKQRQMEFERETGGSGVTAGELRSMLTEAVQDANAPLLARIDVLEERLAPGQTNGLLDDVDAYEAERSEEDAEKSVGRRVST